MSLNDLTEDKVLDALFNNTTFSYGPTLYIKLHTGDPGETSTPANAAGETTRKAITFGTPSGTNPSKITNDSAAAWTNVSTTETYTHWTLWTAVTAGTYIFYGTFTPSIAATATDDFTIAIGDLEVTAQ